MFKALCPFCAVQFSAIGLYPNAMGEVSVIIVNLISLFLPQPPSTVEVK